MSRHPEVKWAETTNEIFLTVLLADSKDTKVNLDPEGVFDFSAKAGPENHLFELKLELHDKVNVEASKINIGQRSIFCILEKAEPERWNKLLRVGKPPHYVKVDWDKWVDEDEEQSGGAGDMDMGGMDFSNFGGPGGMGGLEGLGGMGGLEGLGGMGGMAGMSGMEDFEDSDDEEETAKPAAAAAAAAAAGEEKAATTEEVKSEEQTDVKGDK